MKYTSRYQIQFPYILITLQQFKCLSADYSEGMERHSSILSEKYLD